ncbi:zinc-binding protein A33-like [Latimeria chalumnae]|uniref:zinc-binding protein A33-like n=1 Tax=Latimeria chalumnae TaxID=7897 RepID=UPI00313E0495
MNSETLKRSFGEELNCSECQEVFKDPVTLKCGHNFCRECVCEYWKTTSPSCPICKADSAIFDLTTNITLRNIIESYKKEVKKFKAESEYVCSQHVEELKLYCMVDQEAICIICLTSRKHENHKCLPLKEAAQESKDQREKTEKQIKEDFVKLHQFLHEEEKNLLADLKKEMEEKEQKMRAMEENIIEDLTYISKTIKDIQQMLDEEDQIFLMNLQDTRKRIKEYEDYKPREQEAVSAADIGGYKYTDCLQYRVWKKMLKVINPVTVTLDPSTASPWLTVSEDLTSIRCRSTKENSTNSPNKLDKGPSVLGSEGFSSGRHSWVVEVGNKTAWNLGVASESANRKGIIVLNPEHGYWAIVLRSEDEYSACTNEERTPLEPKTRPKKLLVSLDYEAGKVTFYNADDMSQIYTFTDKFTEKIFPYFSPLYNRTHKNGDPLRICLL